ncbi:MAG: serine hydrolase [Candidatus Peribacteraceae bacterium]|jgi:D-alanyl-D-alanine carboxypeptidase|nr:serine hydrolase [Candidatus Peribacteraceae bacterium]MDP7646347.1 serine hydrolase [Candidatus Peribacteraceae bacterium]|tara:strand:+ start:864 stop:1844 length:981 start_codon:yes stop_codon:yes gene_type:complete
MYRSIIAALLFGLVPVSLPSMDEVVPVIENLAISPPSEPLEIENRLSASGVLILDAKSGQRLYGKQIDVRRPMASLTKLMTAIIILENHELDELVTIPYKAARIDGNTAYLPVGEDFTVKDLLSAVLIASANDAAYTLAVFHSGTIEAFAEEMNARTEALGLKDTRFRNPIGLDSFEQWSTPQDIAWLAAFVMSYEELFKKLSKRGARIRSVQGSYIDLVHTHALMHINGSSLDEVAKVVAGKTGTTNAAKECLFSLVDFDGRSYLVVLLYSSQRYKDMKTILDTIEEKVEIGDKTHKDENFTFEIRNPNPLRQGFEGQESEINVS